MAQEGQIWNGVFGTMVCGWPKGTYLIWTDAITLSQCGAEQACLSSPTSKHGSNKPSPPDIEVAVTPYPESFGLRGGL